MWGVSPTNPTMEGQRGSVQTTVTTANTKLDPIIINIVGERSEMRHQLESFTERLTTVSRSWKVLIAKCSRPHTPLEIYSLSWPVILYFKTFSSEDYDAIVQGWNDKLRRCDKGDQKWGLFYAEKIWKHVVFFLLCNILSVNLQYSVGLMCERI